MKKIGDKKEIALDDLSRRLYESQMSQQNNWISKVLEILILRADFQKLLQALEMLFLGSVANENFNNNPDKIIESFLNKISNEKFFKKQSNKWKDCFLRTAKALLRNSYLQSIRETSQNKLDQKPMIYSTALNYPNIYTDFFDKDTFVELFDKTFYPAHTQNAGKYGLDPTVILDDNDLAKILNPKNKTARSKVFQIIIDEKTEIDELSTFLKKHWKEIKKILVAGRPNVKEKRIAAKENFLRDIGIYNKYQEFKTSDRKNPYYATQDWLKKQGCNLDRTSLRKLISKINKEMKEINGGK